MSIGIDYVLHALGTAFRLWLYYVALEPYVRRLWPDLLISWSRVLDGRLSDPLVGRDLLVGCLAGAVFTLSNCWPVLIRYRIDPNTITNTSAALATIMQSHQTALMFGLYWLAFFLILRVIFRNTFLASTMFTIGVVVMGIEPEWSWELIVANLFWAALQAFLYVRFGLITVIACWFTLLVLIRFPFTTDFAAWYAHSGNLALVAVLLVTTYGFFTSTLAGRSLHTPTA